MNLSSAGSDFTSPSSFDLVFVAGSQSKSTVCALINIIDDDCVEDREIFYVNLTTSDNDVQIKTGSANVQILDNDGKVLVLLNTKIKFCCYLLFQIGLV